MTENQKKMFLSSNLKLIRTEAEMIQERFAEMLKTSRDNISNYEIGRALPPVDFLVRVSEHFQISIDDLINTDLQNVSEGIRKNNYNIRVNKRSYISKVEMLQKENLLLQRHLDDNNKMYNTLKEMYEDLKKNL